MARERDALYSECSLMDALTRGAKLADGRAARGVRHPLTTILMLLLIGFLLGMTSYREMHRFFSPADPVASEQILTQLRTFLNLPHEIPSVSCLSRTLTVMNVHPIITCCADFLYQLVPHKADMPQHICADGKALRAAENKALTGKNLYVINIFLSSYRLFMNQIKVGPKAQEGKVLEEEIYDVLFQDPSVVTADAMAAKKGIVEIIRNAGSDAILPIKANNRNLMKCLLEFVVSHAASQKDAVDYSVDLNGCSEDEVPSGIVSNTRCAVFDEDNRNEPGSKGKHPIESHVFLDNLYRYPNAAECPSPVLNSGKKNKLYYVLVNDRWVPMAHDHGRYERREYEIITSPDLMRELFVSPFTKGWEQVNAVGMVTRYRGVPARDSITKEQYINVSVTRTPYILTTPETVKEFSQHVRQHWAIEEAHNTLDEVFKEDRCTIRAGNAPENCSFFRKVAYNLISLLNSSSDDKEESSGADNDSGGFRETMERIKRGGIQKLKKILTRRFRSPFLE